MRKHEKKSRKNVYMGLFIVFVMVFSVVGYMFGRDNNGQSMDYNEFSLERVGSQWSITINEKEALFDWFPAEVENINISQDIISRLKSTAEIDTTYDANDTLAKEIAYAQFQFENTIMQQLGTYTRKGFTSNNTYNFQVITCEDSTPIVPVIYFKESEDTRVYMENNCIIAEGKDETSFERIKDRLLYGILGIIG